VGASTGSRPPLLDYWVELAGILERGKFDALFLADVLGIYDVYRGSPDAAIANTVQVPVNDPLLLIPAIRGLSSSNRTVQPNAAMGPPAQRTAPSRRNPVMLSAGTCPFYPAARDTALPALIASGAGAVEVKRLPPYVLAGYFGVKRREVPHTHVPAAYSSSEPPRGGTIQRPFATKLHNP
jgi:hypothetical protein